MKHRHRDRTVTIKIAGYGPTRRTRIEVYPRFVRLSQWWEDDPIGVDCIMLDPATIKRLHKWAQEVQNDATDTAGTG
jgi:hypothetical protein